MPDRLFAAMLAALLCLFGAASAGAADVIDAAGRRVVLPADIGRILPAERNAEVLVFVLAPEKLAGLSRLPERGKLLPGAGRLPVIAWRPRTTPEHMAETAHRVGADLIIDAGPVNPAAVAFANEVQKQAGIPYILVDDSFARMPTVLRSLGANLGAGERAIDLALFAEHAIAGLRGRLLIRPTNTRPHVYFARGYDGLTTALPGSPAGEALDEAGAINVASALGRSGEVAVTRDQLIGWDPEIILVESRSAYDGFLRNAGWRRLKAVRNKRVYLAPSSPFGWIEDPSSVNRLIGLYWLSTLFYPDATQEDLRAMACDFYAKFYEITLTNAQLEAMVKPAGAPPAETTHPIAEPLVGLGAAPPSTLPSDTPRGARAPAVPSAVPSYAPTPPPPPAASAPNAKCTVPGGPSPYLMPMEPTPGAAPETVPPGGAPGVPPPGRRGRPTGLGPLDLLPSPAAVFVPPPMPDLTVPIQVPGSGTGQAPDAGTAR